MQYKTFGELHRHIRKNILKKNQHQFSDLMIQLLDNDIEPIGMSIAYISQIERNKTKPSIDFQTRSMRVFAKYKVPVYLIREYSTLGDVARGKLSLQGMSSEKKQILARMVSMKLTQEQIDELNDLLKEFENEQR